MAPEGPKASPLTRRTATPRIRVVLADDHTLFREGVRRLLEGEAGFVVIGEADTVDGAIGAAQQKPDLLVMDLQLSGEDALDAIGRIKSAGPRTKVILLTTRDDGQAALQAMEAGVSGYLLKARTGREFIEVLRAIHGGAVHLDPSAGWKAIQHFQSTEKNGKPVEGETLTPREREILALLVQGRSNSDIRHKLFITQNTLRTHLRHIYHKLGTQNRVQAAVRAIRNQLA